MKISRVAIPFRVELLLAAAVLSALVLAPATASAAGSTLTVPTQHPTIQSAIDAARPGDRIRLLPGTYVEQLTIAKDLDISGVGALVTTIRAPAALVPGTLGDNAIIEIKGGASVALSKLTVRGPGAGTCEEGALTHGILVLENAHLDLSFASIRHIHDTPLSNCFRSGHGVFVGEPFGSSASANIRFTEISDFTAVGVIGFNAGTTVNVSRSVITGPGRSTVLATTGVELILGAIGNVSNNVISGHDCGSPALGCGPDFFNEFQLAGIVGGGAGTTISENLLFDNQVGIYVGEAARTERNALLGNSYFGIAFQDGSFRSDRDVIVGGVGGIAAIAAFADTTVDLNRVTIQRTSGPRVRKFECCGFRATVNGAP